MSEVKDQVTGVKYRPNDGYRPAEHFPGAVMIPSHDGDYGRQLGQQQEFEVIVDPEYSRPGETDKQAARAPESHAERIEAKPGVRARPDAGSRHSGPAGPQPVDFNAAVESAVAKSLKAMLPPALQAVSKPAGDRQLKDEDVVAPPTVEVVFSGDNVGVITNYYHDVVVEGALVVLIYDTRFKFGMRYTPPEYSENRPNDIRVSLTDSKKKYGPMLVRHVGISFRFNCHDFLVLVAVGD